MPRRARDGQASVGRIYGRGAAVSHSKSTRRARGSACRYAAALAEGSTRLRIRRFARKRPSRRSVATGERAAPVRDDMSVASARVHNALVIALGRDVERRRRVIHDEQRGTAIQRARDAKRWRWPPGTHPARRAGAMAMRESTDSSTRAMRIASAAWSTSSGLSLARCFHDGAVDERGVLGHIGYCCPQHGASPISMPSARMRPLVGLSRPSSRSANDDFPDRSAPPPRWPRPRGCAVQMFERRPPRSER